jgi:hypothetical protein
VVGTQNKPPDYLYGMTFAAPGISWAIPTANPSTYNIRNYVFAANC